jgi:hypothetical protein
MFMLIHAVTLSHQCDYADYHERNATHTDAMLHILTQHNATYTNAMLHILTQHDANTASDD